MTELKRCIACGLSNQFLFRAVIDGREYFYHGSHDCRAPRVDMLATIAKAHADAKCAEQCAENDRLREALEHYNFTRYADTFVRVVDALGTAVLVINGMMEVGPERVERWRLLAQTCDGDHLKSFAQKLEALTPAASDAGENDAASAARNTSKQKEKA